MDVAGATVFVGAAEAAMPFVRNAWNIAPPGAPTEMQARQRCLAGKGGFSDDLGRGCTRDEWLRG